MTAHGAGFSGRIGVGVRPALVLVDVVRAYVEPDGPFWLGSHEAVDRMLQGCRRLLDAARASDRPVVRTVVRYAPGAADAGWFVAKVPALAHFAIDAPGDWGALATALDPRAGESVVAKRHASAFAGTPLASELTARGVDTVVVCGVSTSGCVRATATDALALGLRPLVVGPACADRSEALHARNLADLDAKYADVVDLAGGLAALDVPPGATPS